MMSASSRRRAKARLVEYAKFDSRLLMTSVGCAGLAVATALRVLNRRSKALQVEMSLHRGAFSGWVDRVVEGRVQRSLSSVPPLEGYLESLAPQGATESFFKDPKKLIGKRILAVKSPRDGEKGVLLLDYSFVFSLFAKFFDIDAIAARYHLVLEPSWSGYCDRDILSLARRPFPVFVQNYEERDISLLDRMDCNLISVPIAANWWVDHRIFRPLPDVTKDADVLFNAAWARFKRHDAFFAALGKLRARGHRLKAILVGYRVDMTREDVEKLAAEHGISDQIEMHERLKPADVNLLLNRVKVNVLWSRREGFNRALIEGFFSGTPGMMRQGFNYGYRYPYINSQTGCYATEENFPDKLLEMVNGSSRFAPRAWVEQHMTAQAATKILDDTIGAYCARHGEKWTPGQMAVKVTSLDSMAYWDEARRPEFEPDHAFIASQMRAR